MATSREEMTHLIGKMSETVEAVRWYREQIDGLQEKLKHISVAAPKYGGTGGGNGAGDCVAGEVMKREEIVMLIKTHEKEIIDRLSQHSMLSWVMAETLTKEERAIIWVRYAERLHWDRVAREVNMSRSNCIRVANEGLKKLCLTWDQMQENSKS